MKSETVCILGWPGSKFLKSEKNCISVLGSKCFKSENTNSSKEVKIKNSYRHFHLICARFCSPASAARYSMIIRGAQAGGGWGGDSPTRAATWGEADPRYVLADQPSVSKSSDGPNPKFVLGDGTIVRQNPKFRLTLS